ncbi:S-adenosylmethionine synthetase [Thiohalorhabdus denitrificans]|uniref:S-adenosylmethionine synthase n=1 Tax=Thiohalorhabdus denitrificans TaxID=381306 RepID=A0A0P9CV97_9GAMM|nr:methionine adenosyltransferase [Thiohalorhabdus denitrificans]KPV40587.1 S-adenosylmethionine synthetase [Thiohalorhabdus denitrificans]SCY50390.1 methionine adenosyltransferase [Thiohalorhabdus denitrificans]
METIHTAESVARGHPDKVCDQISDRILDRLLEQDPGARVAVEAAVKTGLVVLLGEVTADARIDLSAWAREIIDEIGYHREGLGFSAEAAGVVDAIEAQSPDIARGVDREGGALGAGDQGIMVGYACDDTAALMPAPQHYAHRIMARQAEALRENRLAWLRPDGKCQLSVRYRDGRPVGLDKLVISLQHAPDADPAAEREAVVEELLRPTLPEGWLPPAGDLLINPTGRFVVGGPKGDAGVTGRKIVQDTYGPQRPHGGGGFSGKDPTKVDRAAAYMARYTAKNLVAAGLARCAEVRLAYAIGVAEPVMVAVDTLGTGAADDRRLAAALRAVFDFTPRGCIDALDLRRPIYTDTARFGHFGRDEPAFTWERTDRTEELRSALG